MAQEMRSGGSLCAHPVGHPARGPVARRSTFKRRIHNKELILKGAMGRLFHLGQRNNTMLVVPGTAGSRTYWYCEYRTVHSHLRAGTACAEEKQARTLMEGMQGLELNARPLLVGGEMSQPHGGGLESALH